MKLISKIWDNIRPKTQREFEEEYLSKATSLVDLENRIRKLDDTKTNWFV